MSRTTSLPGLPLTAASPASSMFLPVAREQADTIVGLAVEGMSIARLAGGFCLAALIGGLLLGGSTPTSRAR